MIKIFIFKLINFFARNINVIRISLKVNANDIIKCIILEISAHLKSQLERNYESVTDPTKVQ